MAKVGWANGTFLGHIANGETEEQLRKRFVELKEVNPKYAPQWVKLGKGTGK